jgi:hypothetical protein
MRARFSGAGELEDAIVKILVTIPHYFRARPDGAHGSEDAAAETSRRAALETALDALAAQFQVRAFELDFDDRSIVHRPPAATGLEIVCVVGESHLLDGVDRSVRRFQVARSGVDPRLLGFECHRLMRDNRDAFDLFFYCEDDLVVRDPLYFAKIAWFARTFGADCVLQPNRFEQPGRGLAAKFYVDGALSARDMAGLVPPDAEATSLRASPFGAELVFERARNPHAGCFCLTRAQLDRWIASPRFLDRDTSFVGPLESAATLGLIRHFKVFKPAAANRWFLEIEHRDTRFSDLFLHPSLGKRGG